MFSLGRKAAPAAPAGGAGSPAAGAGAAASPASAAAAAVKASKNSLRGTRRRLSVVSDNKLIEGIATIGAVDVEDTLAARASESVVRAFAGVSKKGYAPYNPRKRNQDALLMEEHRPSGSLIFGVFDGHGEAGDLVSSYFASRMPSRLVTNPKWAANVPGALSEEVHAIETSLLADASIDSEFSGSTAIFGCLRKKTLTVANIGDSRVILGRKTAGAAGGAAGGAGRGAAAGAGWRAVPVSDDHKPDRPDEQSRIEARGGRVFAVEYEDGVDGPPRVVRCFRP